MNCVDPIEQFCINIFKYRIQIMNNDEQFFMSINLNNEVSTIASKNMDKKKAVTDVFKMKGIWEKLSFDNKKAAFEYLQDMTIYCGIYVYLKGILPLEKI